MEHRNLLNNIKKICNNPYSNGGRGFLHHATQNLEEKKCPCLHNNNTALIKEISMCANSNQTEPTQMLNLKTGLGLMKHLKS